MGDDFVRSGRCPGDGLPKTPAWELFGAAAPRPLPLPPRSWLPPAPAATAASMIADAEGLLADDPVAPGVAPEVVTQPPPPPMDTAPGPHCAAVAGALSPARPVAPKKEQGPPPAASGPPVLVLDDDMSSEEPAFSDEPASEPEFTEATGPPPIIRNLPEMPCGQCYKPVRRQDPGRMCDTHGCNDWVVCRRCAPKGLDTQPLLCPRHQLTRLIPADPQGDDGPWTPARALETLRATKPATIGRLVARLLARCCSPPIAGMEMVAFSMDETRPAGAAATVAAEALGQVWTDHHRNALLGPARRVQRLLSLMNEGDLPLSELDTVMLAYAHRRLGARLPGWRACTAPSVARELSGLAEAFRGEVQTPIPPYCGYATRAYLAKRGSREKPDHTASLPITVRMLLDSRHKVSAGAYQCWDAAVFQAFFCLRAGTPSRVERRHLTQHQGGWILAWDLRTKTRRGDQAAADGPGAVAHQVSASRGRLLDEVILRAFARATLPERKLFPAASPDAVTALMLYSPLSNVQGAFCRQGTWYPGRDRYLPPDVGGARGRDQSIWLVGSYTPGQRALSLHVGRGHDGGGPASPFGRH